MNNSTKRILAMTLKKMMSRYSFDSITVQHLVNEAGVSRKTFYYHFRDIFDLLEWTFREDVREFIETSYQPDQIELALQGFLTYLKENRSLILNAYHALPRELIERHFLDIILPSLKHFYKDSREYQALSEAEQTFVLNMYGFGLSGIILKWIGEGMNQNSEELVRFIMHFFEHNSFGMTRS
ncbi:MAG: TetR/AcrR family transcriptional regulator C-terminal domain-containing protein [Clostridia bacterium]|nr:TetR/AcrR family transcriptional regulator C-terminal domain-containing protein [Clostridia bacterium]